MKGQRTNRGVVPIIVCTLSLLLCLVFPPVTVSAWSQDVSGGQAALPSIHDAFAQIGQKVTGFGGMYIDEKKDTMYVYLVPSQPGDAVQLDRAITEVLGANRPPQHQLKVLEGQYTFLELMDWYAHLRPQVLPMAGVVMTGIDDSANRLRVGIDTLAAAAAVESKLDALGIPRDAVTIVGVRSARAEGSLTDRIRPLYAGLQIQGDKQGAVQCTLGVVARLNGANGFVTASHCANNPFTANDTTLFSQPLRTYPDVTSIGNDSVNPALQPGITCTQGQLRNTCPNGWSCRCTDTLFAQLNNNNNASALGSIARPDAGAITWTGGNNPPPTYTITAKSAAFVPGTTVNQVGITSGNVSGTIDKVCEDWKFTDYNTPRYILCLNEATYAHGPGDSGAPVFVIPNPASTNVTFTGFHTGDVEYLSGTHFAAYSPIDQVQNELGTLTVCADGSC